MPDAYSSTRKIDMIPALKGVRALAFLGIFLSHTGISVFSSLGIWGVSVFLILSGFLMAINYYQKNRIKQVSVKDNLVFSITKVKKLYFLHIIMMISALVFETISIKNNIEVENALAILYKIITNLTLTQSFVPDSAIYYSLNGVSWYLSVCLFLYFCFPWAIKILQKNSDFRSATRGLIVTISIMFVLPLFAKIIAFYRGNEFAKWLLYICPVSRFMDFIVGCLLGKLFIDTDHKSEKKLTYFSLILIIISCIIVQKYRDDISFSALPTWWIWSAIFVLPNAAFVFSIASEEKSILSEMLSSKICKFIGDLSPYAFLIHQVLMKYLELVYEKLGIRINMITTIGIPLIMTIMACILWKLMMQQIDKTRRNRYSQNNT